MVKAPADDPLGMLSGVKAKDKELDLRKPRHVSGYTYLLYQCRTGRQAGMPQFRALGTRFYGGVGGECDCDRW